MLFDDWDKNKDGKITWTEFLRGMNRFKWKLLDLEVLNGRVEKFFGEAYIFKMQGNMDEARENAYKALRLQGAVTKTKPM